MQLFEIFVIMLRVFCFDDGAVMFVFTQRPKNRGLGRGSGPRRQERLQGRVGWAVEHKVFETILATLRGAKTYHVFENPSELRHACR